MSVPNQELHHYLMHTHVLGLLSIFAKWHAAQLLSSNIMYLPKSCTVSKRICRLNIKVLWPF